MKNMTLTIVAALVAVAMLSAVLTVPMQEANAEKRDGDKKDGKDGDKKDGKDGGNNLEINQKQECERAFCTQYIDVDNDQSISEDGRAPDNMN